MPYHILVVDDNDMNLVLLSKILELEGYQVTTAHQRHGSNSIGREKNARPGPSGCDDAGYERI